MIIRDLDVSRRHVDLNTQSPSTMWSHLFAYELSFKWMLLFTSMPLCSTARAVPTSHSNVDHPRISLVNKELQARTSSSDWKGYRAKSSDYGADWYEALDADDKDLAIDEPSLFVFTESVRKGRHRDYLLLKCSRRRCL